MKAFLSVILRTGGMSLAILSTSPYAMPRAATHIPDNSSGLHSAEGGDLGNPIFAEMFRNILQDPVPAIHAKINVDVWQAKPFHIEKTLED